MDTDEEVLHYIEKTLAENSTPEEKLKEVAWALFEYIKGKM